LRPSLTLTNKPTKIELLATVAQPGSHWQQVMSLRHASPNSLFGSTHSTRLPSSSTTRKNRSKNSKRNKRRAVFLLVFAFIFVVLLVVIVYKVFSGKRHRINTKRELRDAPLRSTPNINAINSFHNKHLGEPIWIIGNGPSLNEVDLRKLKGKTTFAVNAIFLSKLIKPTYYVVEDPLVALDRQDEINSDLLDGSTRFFGTNLSPILDEKKDVVFVDVTVDYREYVPIETNWPRFSKNLTKTMYVGGSVTYLCLQLAHWMGASTVYMVGFDHNYVIPDNIHQDGDVSFFSPFFFLNNVDVESKSNRA